MKTCAQYVAAAKSALGDPRMSDRELGERLGGYVQQNIARAKHGYMVDSIALAISKVTGHDPGEVLLVARAEREKDEAVRDALLAYAGKVLRLVPSNAAKAGAVLAVALGAVSVPSPADARPA